MSILNLFPFYFCSFTNSFFFFFFWVKLHKFFELLGCICRALLLVYIVAIRVVYNRSSLSEISHSGREDQSDEAWMKMAVTAFRQPAVVATTATLF